MKLGDLLYNVQISRFLNPSDAEDKAYLAGQPPPPSDKFYLGVFMQIQNESDTAQQVPTDFGVVDTVGTEFKPVPSTSLFALELGGKVAATASCPSLRRPPRTGRSRARWCCSDRRGGDRGPPVDPRHPVGRPALWSGRRRAARASLRSADAEARGEDLADDRGGDRAAVAACVDHHRRRGELRLARRRESGEPGVDLLLGLHARRRLARLERLRPELGGAGLAGDLDAGQSGGGAGSARSRRGSSAAQRRRDLLDVTWTGSAEGRRRRHGPSVSGCGCRRWRSSGRPRPSRAGWPGPRPGRSRSPRGRGHWGSRSGIVLCGGLMAFSA